MRPEKALPPPVKSLWLRLDWLLFSAREVIDRLGFHRL
ncbi:hypothetical protein BQ8794_50490 [Mesorhizobium prunaredense]|uniref:Uncharacterized protein n=1 Tax=Mesorhizobium prunaredense TaxID=1631249 RepID=A0A1R3VES0_9HYPH|nr:hypothetical protein BQ8794_50490 [Mesorhizobium prunaredense]